MDNNTPPPSLAPCNNNTRLPGPMARGTVAQVGGQWVGFGLGLCGLALLCFGCPLLHVPCPSETKHGMVAIAKQWPGLCSVIWLLSFIIQRYCAIPVSDVCVSPLHIVHHYSIQRFVLSLLSHRSMAHLAMDLVALHCVVVRLAPAPVTVTTVLQQCIALYALGFSVLAVVGFVLYHNCGWGGLWEVQCYWPYPYTSCFTGGMLLKRWSAWPPHLETLHPPRCLLQGTICLEAPQKQDVQSQSGWKGQAHDKQTPRPPNCTAMGMTECEALPVPALTGCQGRRM